MYTKEEIRKAESVDIIDYCTQNNISVERDSDRYYRLTEHDSLIIDRTKNIFYWNSKSIGGNVINFIQNVEGTNFKEAMKRLTNEKSDYTTNENVIFTVEPYEYDPNKESNRFDKARDYLIKDRKIDSEIVNDLHEKGLLKQDKFNNVLFLWKDHERVMGCSEQGVIATDKYKRGAWKSIQKNSTTNFGFNVKYGKPKNLKFFESSVDLLSYATLKKGKLTDTQLVSMEGLKHNTVMNYVIKACKELDNSPDSISLCVDNDKGGLTFADKFKHVNFKKKDGSSHSFVNELPNNPSSKLKWDWNDQLKYIKNKELEVTRQRCRSGYDR